MEKLTKEEAKEINKNICKIYRSKRHRHERYEKLYKYIGKLYENEKYTWYLRDIKNSHEIEVKSIGLFAVTVTVLMFCINSIPDAFYVSIKFLAEYLNVPFDVEALNDNKKVLMFIYALVMIWMVQRIIFLFKRAEYIGKLMGDIEKDRETYDVHGKSLCSKLLEDKKT